MNPINQNPMHQNLTHHFSNRALPPILLTLGFTACFTLIGMVFTLCWPIDAAPSSSAAIPVLESSPHPSAQLSIVITGEVQHPGIYQVSPQARIGDVVTLAGGFTPEAMLLPREFSNQGIYAGQILHIPVATEAVNASQSMAVQTVSGTRNKPKKRSSHQTPLSKAPLHKIDLNRASLQELTQLPGVGPALAKRIVKAREEKPFAKSQDIVDRVKGIGPAKYKKMAGWLK